jgi:hypothetical protein
MRESGWMPVEAQEQGASIQNRGHQKHMLRFARMSDLEKFAAQLEPGRHRIDYKNPLATRMDIIVVNSHDRSSGYQLFGSPYRLVCYNGLVISDAVMQHMSIRHVGFKPEKVVQATLGMANEIPAVMEMIAGWQDRELTDAERAELAERALGLRWADKSKAPIRPQMLLEPRRAEDGGDDLWRTWNVVQENLLKGGVQDRELRYQARAENRRAPAAARGVIAIDEKLRINRALWDLGESFIEG